MEPSSAAAWRLALVEESEKWLSPKVEIFTGGRREKYPAGEEPFLAWNSKFSYSELSSLKTMASSRPRTVSIRWCGALFDCILPPCPTEDLWLPFQRLSQRVKLLTGSHLVSLSDLHSFMVGLNFHLGTGQAQPDELGWRLILFAAIFTFKL